MVVYKAVTFLLCIFGMITGKVGKRVYKIVVISVFCTIATLICGAQQESAFSPPPLFADAKPVPVLSGGLAFIPTWDAGSPTMVSIASPVVLVPLGDQFQIESRTAFEGDFQRRHGVSGDFTGAIEKSIDYLQLDYFGNRYVTITAGRFLTPFNIFNERLYPNWIRNMQTDPLILAIGTGSDDGAMVRGGIALNPAVTLNYAAYFSALSTVNHLESERHAGIRASIFLPRKRLEIGMSTQHQLENARINRYGYHMEWQPLRIPLEVRGEGAYSKEEGSGMWMEAAGRFHNSDSVLVRNAQLTVRTQVFQTGTIPSENPVLPTVNTKRTEFGVNYYLNDGWKALASYGWTFTPAGDSTIWTVGMTYRFVIPLGPRE